MALYLDLCLRALNAAPPMSFRPEMGSDGKRQWKTAKATQRSGRMALLPQRRRQTPAEALCTLHDNMLDNNLHVEALQGNGCVDGQQHTRPATKQLSCVLPLAPQGRLIPICMSMYFKKLVVLMDNSSQGRTNQLSCVLPLAPQRHLAEEAPLVNASFFLLEPVPFLWDVGRDPAGHDVSADSLCAREE